MIQRKISRTFPTTPLIEPDLACTNEICLLGARVSGDSANRWERLKRAPEGWWLPHSYPMQRLEARSMLRWRLARGRATRTTAGAHPTVAETTVTSEWFFRSSHCRDAPGGGNVIVGMSSESVQLDLPRLLPGGRRS